MAFLGFRFKMLSNVSMLVLLSIIGLGIGIGYNLCTPKPTTTQSCARDPQMEKSYEPQKLRIHIDSTAKIDKTSRQPVRRLDDKPAEDQCFCQV